MKQHFFSLIELLIVVGILGALTALILPVFHDAEKEARSTVARSAMKDIQWAFGRFHADLLPELRQQHTDNGENTNFYLEDLARYGLWPLFVRNHPVLPESDDWGTSVFRKYPAYDPETGFGWRGGYLEHNNIASIAAPALTYQFTGSPDNMTITQTGAQTPGDACKIPVLRDPYGGYYRLLCPEARTTGGKNLSRLQRLKRMVIVCTGPNRKLETTGSSFLPADDEKYIQSINADDIVPQGDDIVLKLMPTHY